MLRTTTTSTPLVQAESQSQSSVAVSAPITTQIAEPEPTPMDIVSEPESKVSELIPTTETRTSLGFRQPNETDNISSFIIQGTIRSIFEQKNGSIRNLSVIPHLFELVMKNLLFQADFLGLLQRVKEFDVI